MVIFHSYVSLPEGNENYGDSMVIQWRLMRIWLVVWNMNFIFPNSWDDDPI
jgi:hypothetical protein